MFNHKKLLSLVMAGAMATSLMVPAFASTANTADSTASSGLSAAANTSGNTSTEVGATYVAIPINVSVPSSAKAQINPYGLPVTIDAVATGGSDSTISGWQIVSQPMYITNEGTVALKVSASVTAKVTGSKTGAAEMVATAPTDKTTDKQIYAQLQMVANTASITGYTGTSTSDWKATTLSDADKDILNALFAKDGTWTGASSLTLSTDEAQSKADMVTLAAAKAATYDATDAMTAPAAYDKGSVALFRIAGNVTEDPEVAWTTADGFTATIAFTFKPSTTT